MFDQWLAEQPSHKTRVLRLDKFAFPQTVKVHRLRQIIKVVIGTEQFSFTIVGGRANDLDDDVDLGAIYG